MTLDGRFGIMYLAEPGLAWRFGDLGCSGQVLFLFVPGC